MPLSEWEANNPTFLRKLFERTIQVILLAICFGCFIYAATQKPEEEPPAEIIQPVQQEEPQVKETHYDQRTTAETIESRIRADAAVSKVEPDVAVRIARCESSLNPHAKNPQSSARGLYQFTDSTWVYIGTPGDREDAGASINAFLTYYPLHPEWWLECS